MICKKYRLFFTFFLITMALSATSQVFNKLLPLPLIVRRGCTIFIYFPFILCIFWRMAFDLRRFSREQTVVMYYIFGLYCVALLVYRRFLGMEVLESAYYLIVLFGSIALGLQIKDHHLRLTERELYCNLVAILIYMIMYRIVWAVLFHDTDAPININLTSGSVALLSPLILRYFEKKEKVEYVKGITLFCLSTIIIISTGSRSIFILYIFMFFILYFYYFRFRNVFFRISSAICITIAISYFLAVFDVGDIQYALARESNISFLSKIADIFLYEEKNNYKFENLYVNQYNQEETPVEVTQSLSSSALQIGYSDSMREDLMHLGIEQIKKNPWIGTGDILYYYQISEDYGTEQSSHNFIIESIICFGIIGLCLLGVFFFFWLKTYFFFSGISLQWLFMFLSMIFYFSFGFVQPIVYNELICPLFVLVIVYYSMQVKRHKFGRVEK